MQEITTPLITIIVPIYSVEKYIERCVDSLLKQSYKNIEVILVDDGSLDRCPEICDDYARKDKRVRVLHQVNTGLSAARNAGIDIASGEFIGFVDGDDWISEDMYKFLYAAIKDSGADISICNFKYVNDDGTNCGDNSNLPIKDEVLVSTQSIVGKLSTEKNWYWVIACNKLFRRELFFDIRYPVGKLHEDEFVIHKLFLKCQKVSCVSKALYYYLQRSSGITKSKYSIGRLDSAEAHFERAELFLSKDVDPKESYYACSIGLRVMSNSYAHFNLDDSQYRKRYNELNGLYRAVAMKLVKTNLPFFIRARLMVNYMSPYYSWKILERFLRSLKSESPDSAKTTHVKI